VAYDNNRMGRTRRAVLLSAAASALLAAQDQQPEAPGRDIPAPNSDHDQRLPNGKSQNNEIAKEQHQQALKEATDLVTVAQQLKDELQKAGDYVVPLASVKKTEEIERLAKRIRGRLKQ
jgi:hypothetical protein